MKKYASTAIRKAKTDKLDSVRIANHGIDHWLDLIDYKSMDSTYEELKFLGMQYSHYMDMKIESINAFTNVIDRTMPGIKDIIQNDSGSITGKCKLNDFVEEYWHYDCIVQKSENSFTASYCKCNHQPVNMYRPFLQILFS